MRRRKNSQRRNGVKASHAQINSSGAAIHTKIVSAIAHNEKRIAMGMATMPRNLMGRETQRAGA
jgi:hypothetical protein|tara:strand:- start:1016 stop:1207 length:192 start_codon:yes stop_codon:yes gene_type:complete